MNSSIISSSFASTNTSSSRAAQLFAKLSVVSTCALLSGQALAASYTSSESGSWDAAATWGDAGVPVAGDSVNISNGHTVTVGSDEAAADITVGTNDTGLGGLVLDTDASLNVSGAVLVRGGKTLSIGLGTELLADSVTLGSSGASATLVRDGGALAVADLVLNKLSASTTLDPEDRIGVLFVNGYASTVVTVPSVDNVTEGLHLKRANLPTASNNFGLSADLELAGDLSFVRSTLDDNGYNLWIDGTLSNDGATTSFAEQGTTVRDGGVWHMGAVSLGRNPDVSFRPGDVTGDFTLFEQGGSYADASVSQSDADYADNAGEGLTIDGALDLERGSTTSQSVLTLDFDAGLSAGDGGFDWALRVAGDQTSALRSFYALGQIVIGTLPDCESFSSTANIFYDAVTGYTYVGYAVASGPSTYTSSESGDWGDRSTWGCEGVPVAGDSVTISNGHTVTVDGERAAADITVGYNDTGLGGLVLDTDASLDVSGAVLVRGGKTLSMGLGADLLADSVTLGTSSAASTLVREGGVLTVADLVLNQLSASTTLDPDDLVGALYINGYASTVVTVPSANNVVEGLHLYRANMETATNNFGLSADLELAGDLSFLRSTLDDNGHDIWIDGTLSNDSASTATVEGGTTVRDGGVWHIGAVSLRRNPDVSFRPGDVTGDFTLFQQGGGYADASVSQSDADYADNTGEGLTIDGTLTLARSSSTLQSELTLDFDSELSAGDGGFDWALRVAGDQTTALQSFYALGQIDIGTLPDGEDFSAEANIFYDVVTDYTYVGYTLAE